MHSYITWLDPFIKERVRKPFSRHPSSFYTSVPNWNAKTHYVTITKDPDHDSNDEETVGTPGSAGNKIAASNPWAAVAEASEPPTMGMSFPATSAKAPAADATDRRYQVDASQNHTSVHGRVPHFYHYPPSKPSPVSLNFPASMVMWKGSPDSSMFAPQPTLDAHTAHTSSHAHVPAHSTVHTVSERSNGYSLYRDPFQRSTASDIIATSVPKLETSSASTRPSVGDSPFLRDDEALFGQLVASQLRQMSVEQKIRAKFEINQIMYKILLLNFSDLPQSTSAPPDRAPPSYVAVAYPAPETRDHTREQPREVEASRTEVLVNKNGSTRENEVDAKFWKEQNS